MGRLMPVATVLVGLGLGVGFGSITVDSLLDYRAFPKTPTPVTVAQLSALTSVPRGTWVSVVDAQPDCARGYAKPYDTSYVVIGDGRTPAVAIAALNLSVPCEKLTAADFSGVPALCRTVDGAPGNALPDGLAWPGSDWQRWPEHRAVILWTWSGPHNSRTGIWLGGLFALLGASLTWYGIRWLRPRAGDAVVVDPDQFPTTVQLRKGSTLPASIVWLPVLRSELVNARGISTEVTIYHLQLPENVSPLATKTQRVITAHTGPGFAGLIFRSTARDAVAAARSAGSEKVVVLRSDLADLELNKESKATLRGRHLRPMLERPSPGSTLPAGSTK
jgi:hypothetical protein